MVKPSQAHIKASGNCTKPKLSLLSDNQAFQSVKESKAPNKKDATRNTICTTVPHLRGATSPVHPALSQTSSWQHSKMSLVILPASISCSYFNCAVRFCWNYTAFKNLRLVTTISDWLVHLRPYNYQLWYPLTIPSSFIKKQIASIDGGLARHYWSYASYYWYLIQNQIIASRLIHK